MELDLDLVEKILLKIKENDTGRIVLEIEGYSQKTISQHVEFLCAAELVKAQNYSSLNQHYWEPTSMTVKGKRMYSLFLSNRGEAKTQLEELFEEVEMLLDDRY